MCSAASKVGTMVGWSAAKKDEKMAEKSDEKLAVMKDEKKVA